MYYCSNFNILNFADKASVQAKRSYFYIFYIFLNK